MPSSKILPLLCLLICLAFCDICPNPQKAFYQSYSAISNRDYLTSVFEDISLLLPKYSLTYTDKNGTIYQIMDLMPHLYYNQHYQTESYYDQYSVNVTLGMLYLTHTFTFSIKYDNKAVTGHARGRTLFDDSWFTKKISLDVGGLKWNVANVPNLDVNSQINIQFSNPVLTQPQLSIMIQLLNDHLGTNMIKKSIINSVNLQYPIVLEQHMNRQDVLKNSTITYNYNKISLSFTNAVKDYKMNNIKTKGLQAFALFGLDGTSMPACNQLPAQFDQETYGGVQELYSMGIIKEMVIQAINQGLADANLTKKDEVPYFQFYMGDLGNFVQYANQLPAYDSFDLKCNFARERSNQFAFKAYDQHDLYVTLPQNCIISYKNVDIIKASFDLNLIVRLVAQNNYLTAKITGAVIFGDKYTALDSRFVVTDQYIAKYAITAVAKGMVGKQTFGTNWQTMNRKYPVIRILQDYVVIFDVSEK